MWVINKCDSKMVGILYILLSFFGGLLGFSFSIAMSVELSSPFSILGEYFYYLCITSHGVIMVFYFLTTLASGFSNYLIPNMCFLDDMIFPKINLFSFWLVLVSFILMATSLLVGDGVVSGWTLYVPLSSMKFDSSISMDLVIFSIHMFSISSILGSLNLLLTIYFSSVYLSKFLNICPFMWSYMLTSFLFMMSIPSLSCALTLILFDSNFSTFYFDYEFGGDSILYQVMFWLWGHSEVYALILPVFGMVTEILQILCFGSIYNSSGMICSMISLSMLSFLVWGHHMILNGFSIEAKNYFMTLTIIMGMPTGIKVFSWLYSLYSYGGKFSLVVGFMVMFLLSFSFGGVTGVFLSNSSLDILFHDTYFVPGHFHFQLALASVFGFFSGLLFFFNSFFNVISYSFKVKFYLGIMFYVIFIDMSLHMFLPFHILGILGLPSSVSSYSFEYFFLFYISSMGFMGVWVSVIILICYMLILILEIKSL